MKKINIIFLFLFLIFINFIFSSFSSVLAQQKSERWVCLNAKKIGVHEAEVSVSDDKKLLPNSDTYIFECLSNNDCTSGNSQVDLQVFKIDKLSQLQTELDYGLDSTTLSSNPIKSDNQGKIPTFNWESHTARNYQRRWLALNYIDVNDDLGTGDQTSQQIGSISFEEAFSKSDCIAFSWDPYGRVFDSQTLEPISGASVSLLVKRANGSFSLMTPADLLGGNIINPQTTLEDGMFSFVVPDGTYKLIVNKGDYSFPLINSNDLNSNYYKIYSDIYPLKTGEEIIQKGAIQHRDIPFKPKSISQSNQVKLMEYFEDLDKVNSTIIIQGRVSHPLTQIKAYSLKINEANQQTRYRLLTETPIKADNYGKFRIVVDQSNFEPGEFFGDLVFEKTNLTQLSLIKNKILEFLSKFIKNVNAQVLLASSFRFEPILNYIEGYAYDNNGQVIPNAKVSLILNFSNNPSYTTIADEKGYYKISSENIPSMPYRIVYSTATGQSIQASTSKFIAQNITQIKENKININSFNKTTDQKINVKISPSSVHNLPTSSNIIKTKESYNLINQNNQTNNKTNTNNQSIVNKNNIFIILTVLIFILLIGALVIAYFIFQKNKTY